VPGFEGLHPRLKKPIGERLAQAAIRQVYGHAVGAATGPTISGCSVRPRSAEIGEIELRFDRTKLGGERVRVHNYSHGAGAGWSGLEVLTESHASR
jgi:hypothetical protein